MCVYVYLWALLQTLTVHNNFDANWLNNSPLLLQKQEELVYVITYDVLFGQVILIGLNPSGIFYFYFFSHFWLLWSFGTKISCGPSLQQILSTGDAEKFLWRRRDALVSALASLLKRKQVTNVQELIAIYQTSGVCRNNKRFFCFFSKTEEVTRKFWKGLEA